MTDLGAAMAAGGIVIGHRLGPLPRPRGGPGVPRRHWPGAPGPTTRYVTEWLAQQAAGGYVEYDAATGEFSLTEEKAFALTDPDGPLYLPGAFVLALGALRAEPRVTSAFRSGEGLGWHEHDEDVFLGCETFFRPGLPGSPRGRVAAGAGGGGGEAAHRGAGRRTSACGHGASTVLLAEAFPASSFAGSDYHDASIELARKRAADAGVTGQTSFETASAQTFSGDGYDLVATFDCLHDMGDPVGAARHIRESLAPEGTWLMVEPFAGDGLADNLTPLGRAYYGFSTFICVPAGRSQPGGYSLGAQAGPAALRQVAIDAGFTRFRRVADTPLNIVYEVRP